MPFRGFREPPLLPRSRGAWSRALQSLKRCARWRQLRPGEIDHEAIWLGISLLGFAGAWVWLYLALPIPSCTFHRWTGLPCPTCGATRCLRYALHRDWWAAAGTNPLAFLSYSLIPLYDLYAAVVLLFRLPRLRFEGISARVGNLVRYSTIAVLLGNWAWLVWMRV